jgi:ATP-dependent Clp protease ATP-binding subunit ClpA
MSISSSCAAPRDYVDKELASLITGDDEDAKPTAGFQRVIQRAVIHVQSSGREEVTGANVLVAIFAERESHAAYFLQEQDMTRYDAVNFISHGIAKRPGRSKAARPGAEEPTDGRPRPRARKAARRSTQDALTPIASTSTRRPRRQDRSADRPQAEVNRTIQMLCRRSKNNPLYRGRSGRRQDGHRRRASPSASSNGDVPEVLSTHHLLARHGRAAGRHALSR